MPRRSSLGKSAPRPAARSSSHTPKPASSPPPGPVQGGNSSLLGGLGATVAEGMAFGTGSAIARRAVDAMLGPQVIQHETVASSAPADAPPAQRNTSGKAYDACGGQYKALQELARLQCRNEAYGAVLVLSKSDQLNMIECLNNFGSDISKCQFYMDMLQQCRQSSGASLGA